MQLIQMTKEAYHIISKNFAESYRFKTHVYFKPNKNIENIQAI